MIEVGRLDDFPERSVTLVSVGRLEIGVVRWDGDGVYALRNVCPHERGPVCAGRLGPKVVASGGDPLRLDVDDSCPVLACAWHGWEFDVRSGRALCAGSRYRVRTYPVRLEDGRVLVDVGTGRRRGDGGACGGS
jgi:nitrite reductase/ring-hydroxylating ferredoxin subunit